VYTCKPTYLPILLHIDGCFPDKSGVAGPLPVFSSTYYRTEPFIQAIQVFDVFADIQPTSSKHWIKHKTGDNPRQEKRWLNGVLYNLWPLLTVAMSMLLAAPAWLKLKGVAGHWLVQHTAQVRARPYGRPCLEGARYKYPTSCSLPTYPSSMLHVTHTLAHTYQFPSSPWANTLDHYEVSVQSRLDLYPQQ